MGTYEHHQGLELAVGVGEGSPIGEAGILETEGFSDGEGELLGIIDGITTAPAP